MRSSILLLAFGASAALAQTSTGSRILYSLDVAKVVEMQHGRPMAQAEFLNPVNEQRFVYEGYWLSDVLRSIPNFERYDPTQTMLVFRSKDHYDPILGLDRALAKRGFLALKSTGAPGLLPAMKDGKAIALDPAFVLWEGGPFPSHEYPYPYELLRIDLVRKSAVMANIDPAGRESRGFRLFRDRCLRCHSVNLIGGELGPELNVPVNVTEYWDEAILKHYIKAPASVRAHSQMPAWADASAADLDAVVGYLKEMRGKKVAPYDR